MIGQEEMRQIIEELRTGLADIFPGERIEPILFGSYARGDAEEGSDIDILFLVDAAREDIFRKDRMIGDLAGDLLIAYGVLVSPIVENREHFNRYMEVLPFYQNIQKDGVRLYA